ncbi:MAG: T9SS type A sorting domain-containing protein [Paludibacter sp.]|nr:T9SS type A sorting domain-containing protein [Paludibacter sp.]
MKKLIFFIMLCIAFNPSIKAQTVIFSDDIESYTVGASLGSSGYDIWEGTAKIAEGDAFQGTKYVNCSGTASKTFYFRKTVSLIAGKSYTLKLATQAPAAKSHKIGYKFASSSAVTSDAKTNTTWQESIINFTANATEDMTFWVQFFGAGNVYVDNIRLTEDVSTVVPRVLVQSFSVKRISGTGLFRIEGQEKLKKVEVIDIHGRIIVSESEDISEVNLTAFPNGIYVLRIQDAKGNRQLTKLTKY